MPLLTSIGKFAHFSNTPKENLPVGAVLLWDSSISNATPPVGFQRYASGLGNYLIRGAATVEVSNTTSAGSSGRIRGNPTIIPTQDSSSGVSSYTHRDPLGPEVDWGGVTTSPQNSPTVRLPHSHTHTIRSPVLPWPGGDGQVVPAATLPSGKQMPMLECLVQTKKIPAGCIIFRSSLPTGFTRYNFSATNTRGVVINSPNNAKANYDNALGPYPITVNPFNPANHQHSPNPNNANRPSPVPTASTITSNPGGLNIPIHTHPGSEVPAFYIFEQFKSLLPFTSTSDMDVQPGMIIMYKGTTVPRGWSLCDGTNGTPDMRNFYLGFDDSENNNNIVKSAKGISTSSNYPATPTTSTISTYPGPGEQVVSTPWSVNLAAAPWPHTHQTSPFPRPGNFVRVYTTAHGPFPGSHGHTITDKSAFFTLSYTPRYININFIQKD